MQTHRRTVESENEAFFLRIPKPGDYKYEGADLGILITPGRLMTEGSELDDRARKWTSGILSRFESRPLEWPGICLEHDFSGFVEQELELRFS